MKLNRLELILFALIIGIHVNAIISISEIDELPIIYEYFSKQINSLVFFLTSYLVAELIHWKEKTGFSGLLTGLYQLIKARPKTGIFLLGTLIGVYDLLTGYVPLVDIVQIFKLLFTEDNSQD